MGNRRDSRRSVFDIRVAALRFIANAARIRLAIAASFVGRGFFLSRQLRRPHGTASAKKFKVAASFTNAAPYRMARLRRHLFLFAVPDASTRHHGILQLLCFPFADDAHAAYHHNARVPRFRLGLLLPLRTPVSFISRGKDNHSFN